MAVRIFIVLIMFYSSFSVAQLTLQLKPTQPQDLMLPPIHTKPLPDHDLFKCQNTYSFCVDPSMFNTSPSQLFEENCTSEHEFGGFTPNRQADCGDPSEARSFTCYACECPSGQLRIDGICIPQKNCEVGVRDFVTGDCWPYECPFGDGTPENCGEVPHCLSEENAFLVEHADNTLSCDCPISTHWNKVNRVCDVPLCNGFDGSPIGSVFDGAIDACSCPVTSVLDQITHSCVSQICDNVFQVFVKERGKCEIGLQCPYGFDLNTNSNKCYKVTNDSMQCSRIDYQMDEINSKAGPCIRNPLTPSEPLPQECLGVTVGDGGYYEDENKRNCEMCLLNGDYIDLTYSAIDRGTVKMLRGGCLTPQSFCQVRNGTWNSNLNTCMNGNLQNGLPPPSSKSSSSRLASSHSSFSSVSSISSSVDNHGGGGCTIDCGGAGGSAGSGGGGNNPGGGTGGGGTGSASGSVANNSAASNANTSTPSNGNTSVPSNGNTSTNGNGNTSTPSNGNTSAGGNGGGNNSANNGGGNTSANNGGGGCTINCNGDGGGEGGSAGGGAGGSAGSGGGGGNNGGGNGNNTSAGSNNSTPSSTKSGPCDPQKSDYLDCIGKNKKPLPEHVKTDSGATTFDEVGKKYTDRLNASPIVNSFSNVKQVIQISDNQCPELSIDLSEQLGRVISTTIHCDLMELILPFLNIVTLIGWSILGFRIFASA